MNYGYSFSAIVERTQELKQVCKCELHVGDRVLIKTNNSVYSVRVIDGGFYLVSGGWSDRKGLSPVKTTINGYTWGGSAIKHDIIAACGLMIEFGNRIRTSIIQKIFVLQGELLN